MTARFVSPSFAATALALVLPGALTTTLRGQDLALGRALVGAEFAVHLGAPGAPGIPAGLPARADVTAGFDVARSGPAGSASAGCSFQRVDQSLRGHLTGSCAVDGASVAGAAGGVGRPSVVLHFVIPRAMAVRLTARVGAVVGVGAPPCRGLVDVGDDGQAELDFTSSGVVCDSTQRSWILDLPAGELAVRLQVDVELPAAAIGANAVCASMLAAVELEPAHATVQLEGPSCGTHVEVTPLLDGLHARCYVSHLHSGSLAWLVFGGAPALVTLPTAPGCSLLVTPDVVLPMSPTSYTLLPLALLGPSEWFAQGVTLQQATPWQPVPQLLASSRLRVRIR